MSRPGLIGKRLAVVAIGLALVASCGDEEVGVQAGPHLLAASFHEQFRIGDDPAERPFTRITSMAFAPDGHLVVVDHDDFAVVVLDREGAEVHEWGGEGEGPAEFETQPDEVAVSSDGNVAVTSFRRVDVFTPSGIVIGSHLLDDRFVRKVAFDGAGFVLAGVNRGGAMLSNEEEQDYILRLRDREELWSSAVRPPGPDIGFFFPSTVVAGLDADRVVVATNDRYEIDILDSATGRVLDRVVRNITPRAPPEALMDNLKGNLVGMENDPSMVEIIESMEFGETLPVLSDVFLGPPGSTVWVRRGIGVDDELAPPVGESIDDWTFRLYDLFDGRSYEYIGTVEIPENLDLLAGDSGRVAGVQRDELGVQSVRVLAVEFN